jgi:hypothetical protein
MATATATADSAGTGAALFSVPLNQKGNISAIDIDNGGGSQAHTIQILDGFTPNAGINYPSPSLQSKIRAQITVPMGSFISLDELSLKDCECLGVVTALADVTDAGCGIVVRYSLV